MKRILICLTAFLLIAGCAKSDTAYTDEDVMKIAASQSEYEKIAEIARNIACRTDYAYLSTEDQESAMQMMEEESDYIILDVRTLAEYDSGHIPGAICIPNERIDDSPLSQLPDLSQTIFVYCRTGRRSKEAAQKLADIGYTGIIEIGGIETWPGEIVTEEKEN